MDISFDRSRLRFDQRLIQCPLAGHRGELNVEASQLIGRQIHLRAAELSGVTVTAVIRAVDPETSSLLLEFVPPAQNGSQTYPFAIARPRLERDDLGVLLDNGVLGCGIVCVPEDRHDPARPFDLSWWRGGGAAIGDLILDDPVM